MNALSEAQTADLRERLVKAQGELQDSSDAMLLRGYRAAQDASVRLDGKAEGVGLALSYLDEYLRGAL